LDKNHSGIANARDAVSTPPVNRATANCSGTTKAYVNIGKDARKIIEETMTRNTFIMSPVFHRKDPAR
jgi:hypothetical protein